MDWPITGAATGSGGCATNEKVITLSAANANILPGMKVELSTKLWYSSWSSYKIISNIAIYPPKYSQFQI